MCAAGLAVFARLVLHNATAFQQFLAAAEPNIAQTAAAPAGAGPLGQRLLLVLVDLWMDKFDSIGQPQARKLSALALCVLLTLPVPEVLLRLELIAGCLTAVWFEVCFANCPYSAHTGAHRVHNFNSGLFVDCFSTCQYRMP